MRGTKEISDKCRGSRWIVKPCGAALSAEPGEEPEEVDEALSTGVARVEVDVDVDVDAPASSDLNLIEKTLFLCSICIIANVACDDALLHDDVVES